MESLRLQQFLASCPMSAIQSAVSGARKALRKTQDVVEDEAAALLEYKIKACKMVADWSEERFWKDIEEEGPSNNRYPNKLNKELLLIAII